LSEKEEEREFQFEMLKASLKHERQVTQYSVLIAVGAAFIVFGLTLDATIWVSGKAFSPEVLLWNIYALLWSFIGLGILSPTLNKMKKLKPSEENDLKEIYEKFVKPKTEKKVSEK
jgi:hypothetical protein